MFHGKPIIGLAGGIGSGKSYVAGVLGTMNCLAISSDELVRQAYQSPSLKEALRRWLGGEIFTATGEVDRGALAKKVFADDSRRRRLEGLIHPIVARRREEIMEAEKNNDSVLAFVWDVPLLYETGLNRRCDAVIFVEASLDLRDQRLARTRGWTPDERIRRENLQLPLDKKRELSDYIVSSTVEEPAFHEQIRDVLLKILASTDQSGNRRSSPAK